MMLGGVQTMASDEVWRMGMARFLQLGKLVRIIAILGVVYLPTLMFFKVMALQWTILFNLPGQCSATFRAKAVWARWITIAEPLIKMGLMKPSQIESRLRKKYFLALIPRLWSADSEMAAGFQHKLPVDSLKVQPPLPRPKQEYVQKQELVTTMMSSQLMPPIASIIDKLSAEPAKLDLFADDLEYYFLHSGLIELKFSQQNEYYQSLHIFYRGDPLLLTCPIQFVRGYCSRVPGHNRRTCVCDLSFTIYPQNCKVTEPTELAEFAKFRVQLEKNITFIRTLSPWMLANLATSSTTILAPEPSTRIPNYLTVSIESILPWTEQLQRESKSVTIELNSISFMVGDTSDDKVHCHPNIKFVGAEKLISILS